MPEEAVIEITLYMLAELLPAALVNPQEEVLSSYIYIQTDHIRNYFIDFLSALRFGEHFHF